MYTSDFGLAMWRPSKINVGDIGYFSAGGFVTLSANIFDAPFSFASPETIGISEYTYPSGGIICVHEAGLHRETVELSEQK